MPLEELDWNAALAAAHSVDSSLALRSAAGTVPDAPEAAGIVVVSEVVAELAIGLVLLARVLALLPLTWEL